MSRKLVIPSNIGESIISDYLEGILLKDIYDKYSAIGSPTTISRYIRNNTVKNRTKSGPRRLACISCQLPVYRKKFCMRHYRENLASRKGRCNVENCSTLQVAQGMCDLHYRRAKNNKPLIKEVGCWVNTSGYVCEYMPNHIQANTDGRTLQHRRVMADSLNRRLESFETVHHKDGDKMNNNIENLELWASVHPRGQRAEDLLAFASRIQELYG